MLKLRFSKPEIKTFLNGQITKCYIKCQIVETQTDNVLDKFSVSGQARCNPVDKLDPVLGAILAESRAKSRAYARAEDYTCNVLDNMGASDLLDLNQQMWYLKEAEKAHEASLVGKEEE